MRVLNQPKHIAEWIEHQSHTNVAADILDAQAISRTKLHQALQLVLIDRTYAVISARRFGGLQALQESLLFSWY